MKHKLVVAVTGASGSIYTKVLFDKLLLLEEQIESLRVVMSNNAKDVWAYELGNNSYEQYPFKFYAKGDFFAPFASGSAKYNVMLVCPCSMGTLSRITHGISDDLITRVADVRIKGATKVDFDGKGYSVQPHTFKQHENADRSGWQSLSASPSFYSRSSIFRGVSRYSS